MPSFERPVSLQSSVVAAVGIRGIGFALLLCSNILLARMLGQVGYGEFSFLLAAASLAAIPASAGLPLLVTRETAAAASNADRAHAARVRNFANLAVAVNALVVAAFAVYFLESRWTAAVFTLVVALFGLEQIRAGAMIGLGKGALSQVPDAWVRPVALMVFLGTLGLFLHSAPSFLWALTGYAAAMIVTLVVGMVLLSRAMRPLQEVSALENRGGVRGWLRSWFRLGLLGGSQRLLGTLDIVLLGVVGTASAVGDYKVGVQLALACAVINVSAGPVLASRLAGMVVKDDWVGVEGIARRGATILSLATICVGVAIACGGEHLILLAFGRDYGGAYWVVLPLIVSQAVNAATGPSLSILTLSGREREAMGGLCFGLVLLVALAVPLANEWGGFGMALAVAASNIGMNLHLMARVIAKCRVNPSVLPWRIRA